MGRIAAALGLAFALAAPAAWAQEDPALDSYLETVRTEFGVPAIVAAVVSQGEIIEAGAAGVRALGRDETVTIDDRFHLGSDTKAMTATLAGMMIEEGKLRWDSTIGEVLGETVQGINPTLAAVTIEQLLSHSSGIPFDNAEIAALYFSPAAYEDTLPALRLQALDAWKDNVPVIPEVSPFQYSNLGYIIAGSMIETVAGESWEELIQERIFAPLDLTTAGLGAQATTGLYDAAIGHLLMDDGTLKPLPWGTAAESPPMVGPAGTAHMSILDFARWAAWNAGEGSRGPALVSPETLARIHRSHVVTPPIPNPVPGTPTQGEYALGWGIAKYDWSTRPLLNHNGSNGRMIAKILVDTEADFAIVVMTNAGGKQSEASAGAVIRHLYETYGPKE